MNPYSAILPLDEKRVASKTKPFFAVFLSILLCMASSLASGQAGGKFSRECAQHDLDLVAALDGHRFAQDIGPENLAAAFMAILGARETCYADPDKALVMYDAIVFGPALVRMQRQEHAWGTLD